MKIHWANQTTGIAAAFGYTTFAQKLLRELVKKDVEYDRESPVSVHMMPPFFFRMTRFKKNVLFTMFEFDALPSQWHTYADRADLVIVPCKHNRNLFEAITDTPVEICPGGVDAQLYPYTQRTVGDVFTFLFVGDHNIRKGTKHVAEAWELWNKRYPQLSDKTQLIMKMTSYEKKQELIQTTPNAYCDYRVLPLSEHEAQEKDLPTLPSLYEYANCFLFPTMGEGWGLPLCEAMATGLPCIYTPFGGTEDTASDQYAYPVEYEMQELNIYDPFGGHIDPVNAPSPIIESIVDNMAEIYFNYENALEKGRMAAWAMAEYFGWDKSADTLIDIIKRHYPEVA